MESAISAISSAYSSSWRSTCSWFCIFILLPTNSASWLKKFQATARKLQENPTENCIQKGHLLTSNTLENLPYDCIAHLVLMCGACRTLNSLYLAKSASSGLNADYKASQFAESYTYFRSTKQRYRGVLNSLTFSARTLTVNIWSTHPYTSMTAVETILVL